MSSAGTDDTPLWYVRWFFIEDGQVVYDDEGPWDYYLASLVLQDAGVDASIPRGLGRVTVLRGHLEEGGSRRVT